MPQINLRELWHLHVPVNRGTKEKGLAGEHFIDTYHSKFYIRINNRNSVRHSMC